MTVHHFTFHITDKSDASDIREVETRAFGFSKEADLVASLLEDESARPALSLLARYEGKAVGHILFTRATFKGEMDSPLMHILAPLAVIPEYQGMGVGALALLVAMEVVLARFLGIQTPIVQIKLSFIPVVMAALLYGPVPAALAAALGDFIGAVLFPSGAYFPGFTLTAALGGLVYGLVLYRKPASLWRSCLAVGIITIVLNLGLNTFWLWMITKDGYLGLLAARFPKYFITVPVQIAVIRLLTGRVGQAVRRIALT